ncbi:MAG: TolC family protein [Bacteroidetes bacterium]|nr:TolC family protein [Bacteroidota bacterium]
MKRIFIFIAFILPLCALAQQSITLKDAIDLALKNNFDIQIAKNYAEIDKISNTYGVAGGLPSINASAGDNQTFTNIHQELSGGTVTDISNASGNNITAGVNATMPLFNGFKILATKERLNLLQKQSELELNQQIQNTIATVMLKYYDIVRQISYLKVIQNSFSVSQKRMEIITQKKNVGMANDADMMQAQIDLNNAEQTIKSQQIIIDQAKTDLLQILSVKQYYPFEVKDTIIIDKTLQLDSITRNLTENKLYQSFEQQIKINEQIVKEIAALRYPSIKLTTGYNYISNKNDAGLTLLNQAYGPSVGVTLQIPLYNGNAFKIQRDIAKYNVSNAQLQKENIFNLYSANAIKTFQSYSNTLQQLLAQQANYELSGKLLSLLLQKFQVSQTTILDLKAGQASFENAGYLLINLQYSAKVSEIELKRLTYRLSY